MMDTQATPVKYDTPCNDFSRVMYLNTDIILPEDADYTYEDTTLIKWEGSMRDLKKGEPMPAWDLTDDNNGPESKVTVTVCAITFRRSFCASAAIQQTLWKPDAPNIVTGITTEIISGPVGGVDLLVIDWDNPSFDKTKIDTDQDCTVTKYDVFLLDSNGDHIQETTYCAQDTVYENHVCSVPASIMLVAPYSLASGTTVTAEVTAYCQTLSSPDSTAAGTAVLP